MDNEELEKRITKLEKQFEAHTLSTTKCPVNKCEFRDEIERSYSWFRLFGFPIFPKFWIKKIPYLYCPAHGNFIYKDSAWWWYSYFRPGLLLEYEAIAKCPKCLGNSCFGEFNSVHKGKDGIYYCSECNWKSQSLD